ncbi:MAG TPA: hypothetical protein VLI70_03515 [Micrococcaceae bacterium]|nr:hypothetical protein [Micrococcaceae bacterium]
MVDPPGITIPGMVEPSGMTIPGGMVPPAGADGPEADCCPAPVPGPLSPGDGAAAVVEHPANRTTEAARTPHLTACLAIADSSARYRLPVFGAASTLDC